ncbi:hypothetical protein B0J15DRAFT_494686 [Fusarium solani]|uniref:Uncharacterized protein n=1 Tax=Fusarium solani TaxID=169388 RepID=A0A9P9HCK2_FUSSL|nr:uncharacterized protein B0J15DRAFT_494686 [Fusarium solani]KAH7254612.1 hypothetical protein B0J15DRAFT_494686 [Fusarium solani]
MVSLSPSTWNTLGLGVAAGWATLGLVGFFQQLDQLSSMALILGSRDFSIATALFMLGRAGRNEEMGTLILSTLVICGADIYLVWKAKRYAETITFTVGAAIWGAIGLGLWASPLK